MSINIKIGDCVNTPLGTLIVDEVDVDNEWIYMYGNGLTWNGSMREFTNIFTNMGFELTD